MAEADAVSDGASAGRRRAAGARASGVVARVLRPFHEFAAAGSLGGIALLAAGAVALVCANAPWADAWAAFWRTPVAVGPSGHALVLTVRQWVDDGLMAAFFLLVGLEIKRELLVGELASPRRAALPIAAAVGGAAVPALLYLLVNAGGAGARGWGIPMATDIAFALGVVTLLGPRVPHGLRIFLTALAIVDDLIAVLVIAVAYTVSVHAGALAAAAALTAALVVLNRAGVRRLGPYLGLGVLLWLAVHESGVHATVAGVVLALTIPADTPVDAAAFSRRARDLLDAFDRGETGDRLVLTSPRQQEALHALDVVASAAAPPLLRLEHALHRPIALVVMPLFALANAGVALGTFAGALSSPIALGIALGLVVGKPLGITLAARLAVRAGVAALPEGVGWGALHGAAWLGGIGFTMALFVATLAFGDSPLLETAKAGVLAASALAGTVGAVLLSRRAPGTA